MNLPLITILEKLNLELLNVPNQNLPNVSGIRLIDDCPLERGVINVGEIPVEGMKYNEGALALFCCKPVTTPYSSLFVKYDGGAIKLANYLLKMFDFYREYHEKLLHIVFEEKDLKKFVILCSKLMGNPAYLVDSSFKVVAIDDSPIYSEISAIWKHLANDGYLSYDIVFNLRRSDELKLMESYKQAILFDSHYFNNPFINYNLRQEGRIQGHFFVVGYNKKITPGDIAYADYLGKLALLALENNYIHSVSRGREYENFFIHVLTGTLKDPTQILKQMVPLGWDIEGRYLLFRMILKDDDELLLEATCTRLENIKSGKPLIYEAGIVAVFPLQDGESVSIIKNQVREIVEESGGRGSFSDEFRGFYRSHTYYCQTCIALELLGDKSPSTVTYGELSITHLLHEAEKTMDLDILCDNSIFRLRDFDKNNKTDYFHTLESYLLNERSIALTAENLSIHRNTLLYRLEKLNKMLDLNLNDYVTRLRLLLTFKILEYKDIIKN
jgi:sugar diacid utilization regulator